MLQFEDTPAVNANTIGNVVDKSDPLVDATSS